MSKPAELGVLQGSDEKHTDAYFTVRRRSIADTDAVRRQQGSRAICFADGQVDWSGDFDEV